MESTQRITQATMLNRRKMRNGTILAASQTARLGVANLPLAQEVGEHVHRLIVALKAPKENDTSAQELAEQIRELMGVVEEAAEDLDDATIVDIHGSSAACLGEFQRLYDCLQRALSELQAIHDCRFTTKLASQTKIHETILRIKDELIIRLTMFNLATGVHNAQTVRWLEDSLNRHLEASNQRFERLERRFDAVLASRQIDGRRRRGVAHFGLNDEHLIFFLHCLDRSPCPMKRLRSQCLAR